MYTVKPVFEVATTSVALPTCMYKVAPFVDLPSDGSCEAGAVDISHVEAEQTMVMHKIRELEQRIAKLMGGKAGQTAAANASVSVKTRPLLVAANISVTIPIKTSRPVLYAILDMLIAHTRIGKLCFHTHCSALRKSVEPFPQRFLVGTDAIALGTSTDLLTIRVIVADVGRMTITTNLSRRTLSGVAGLKYLAGLVGRQGLYDETDVDDTVKHDEALDFVDRIAMNDVNKALQEINSRLQENSIVSGTAKGVLRLADLYLWSVLSEVPKKSLDKYPNVAAFTVFAASTL